MSAKGEPSIDPAEEAGVAKAPAEDTQDVPDRPVPPGTRGADPTDASSGTTMVPV